MCRNEYAYVVTISLFCIDQKYTCARGHVLEEHEMSHVEWHSRRTQYTDFWPKCRLGQGHGHGKGHEQVLGLPYGSRNRSTRTYWNWLREWNWRFRGCDWNWSRSWSIALDLGVVTVTTGKSSSEKSGHEIRSLLGWDQDKKDKKISGSPEYMTTIDLWSWCQEWIKWTQHNNTKWNMLRQEHILQRSGVI